jgi:hypothetical protein
MMLKELHEGVTCGHFVVDITIKKILDVRYWRATLFEDVMEYCIFVTCANEHVV